MPERNSRINDAPERLMCGFIQQPLAPSWRLILFRKASVVFTLYAGLLFQLAAGLDT